MGYGINFKGGHLSMVFTDFNCPKCTCRHGEEDYYERLYKSKKHYIYKKCKGCKTTLGITHDIKGDVVVWLKEDENKKLNQ